MGIDTDIVYEEDRKHIEDFECVICRMLAGEPKQCQKCRKYFCEECISEWRSKNAKCPLKCSEEDMVIGELKSDELSLYLSIRILCDRGCNKHYPLADYVDHVTLCQLPDCSPECGRKVKYTYENQNVCSYNCLMMKCPELLEDPLLNAENIMKTHPDIDLTKSFPIIWDDKKSSDEIRIVNMNIFTSTSMDNNFHTIVSKVGLMGGIHRFDMEIPKSTHPMKIGITKDPNTPSKAHAFCDDVSGFAIYTIGQTRNNSNGSGMLFGEKLDNNVPHKIRMELSMGEGKLKFKFDDKNYGAAFDENDLKEGPFYVAFAIRMGVGEVKVVPVNIF